LFCTYNRDTWFSEDAVYNKYRSTTHRLDGYYNMVSSTYIKDTWFSGVYKTIHFTLSVEWMALL